MQILLLNNQQDHPDSDKSSTGTSTDTGQSSSHKPKGIVRSPHSQILADPIDDERCHRNHEADKEVKRPELDRPEKKADRYPHDKT
jgi:hypothetical protein